MTLPDLQSTNKVARLGGGQKSAAMTYSRLATTIGRAGLTTVFGMVTGVTLHVLSPQRR